MACLQPFRGDSAQLLLYKIASCINDGGFVSGVSSFNGQTGAITFTGADIITLLGCTPACEGDVVNSFNGQTGDVTLTSGDVTTALGFTPISEADGDARYVLKTGDTMTGPLSIDNGAFVADSSGVILTTSLTLPYVAKVATYTASAVDYTIDCTAGTFTINLPTAVGITGRVYVIKNSGVGTITVDPAGAELIDSLATQTIVSGGASMVQSTGTGWIII